MAEDSEEVAASAEVASEASEAAALAAAELREAGSCLLRIENCRAVTAWQPRIIEF